MRMCAKYQLSAVECECFPDGGRSYADAEYDGYTPNVHIDKYECFGDFSRIVPEMLSNHDYISAIEECVTSCVSLNLHDAAVVKETMRRIYGNGCAHNNPKCFELPDGRVVRAVEAIEYLKGEQENVEETQAE